MSEWLFDKNSTEDSSDLNESHLGSRDEPLSVSELTSKIKNNLETGFSDIVVVGEISNFKAHPSGHFYFSLKDESAMISAVMFRGANSKLKFKFENGQRILAMGKITVYPPRGNYQMMLVRAEPEGVGSLQLAFEQLKKKLQAEGLFDEDRKKPIPRFPKCIGVVTASSGAAIQDILNVLDRRFSGLRVLIYPVKVQGDVAAAEVAQAIEHLNKFFPEVEAMIVGRGGGSIEDLWAFNEEVVARAIARSEIPIISAVGHEVDFTIADFVADLRAPTPSAAAELVISNKLETIRHLDHLTQRLQKFITKLEYLVLRVDDLSSRLSSLLKDRLSKLQMKHERLRGRLQERSPIAVFKDLNQRFLIIDRDLKRCPEKILERYQRRIETAETKLKLLNPRSIMDRGYSLVKVAKTGKIIRKVSDVQMGDRLLIEFSKGKITARV